MADILNRLLLDTSNFDAKLNNSKKGVSSYQSGVTNMAKTAGAGILKFAAAFGVAMGASEAFSKTISSSQTTSDEYDRVMRSVKNSVDSFFTAISTGDFTVFNQGLDEIVKKARAASSSLDQLGNTVISYGYFNTKNQADFAEAIAVMRDPEASKSNKETAKVTADRLMGNQKEITEQLRKRADEAAQALVVEGNSLKAGSITRVDMDKVLALDVSSMGDSEKERLAKMYKEYTDIYNKVVKENTKTTIMQGTFGATLQSAPDYEAVGKAMESVNNEYQSAILYNEILVRKSDDWLKNLVGILNTADNADRTMAGMQKTLNRAMGSQNGGGNEKENTPPPPVGSIAAIDAEIAIKNKELINATTMQARIAVQATINELENRKISLKMEIEKSIFVNQHGSNKSVSLSEMAGVINGGTDKTKGSSKTDLKNIKTPSIKVPINKKDINLLEQYQDNLYGISSIMGSMSGIMDGNASSWLNWGASLLSSIAQAIPAISQLIPALSAKAAAETAAENAAMGPFGWIAAGAAVAGILAVFASFPKFANGGIIQGGSTFGDMNLARVNAGEMILNGVQQGNLFRLLNGGSNESNKGGAVSFRIQGKDLVGVLSNYNSQKNKVR